MDETAMNPQASEPADGSQDTGGPIGRQPLCRPVRDRMLAGVAAGLADYLGIDVTVVRIALTVLALVGGLGVPLYLAGWLLIPEEGCPESIAAELIGSLSARSY